MTFYDFSEGECAQVVCIRQNWDHFFTFFTYILFTF